MKLMTLLKLLAPPLLVSLIKKLLHPKISKLRYSTYENASLACQHHAYQNSDLVKVVVEENLIYREKLKSNSVFDLASLRTLIALGISKNRGTIRNRLNVIDFGGGAGYHYTVANVALGLNSSISWCVVETTAMSKEAEKLSNRNLKFFDDIADAKNSIGEVDLVFTSSALQYCPDPIYFLRKLVELNAPYFFITRTPFSLGQNLLITTQTSKLSDNGPGPLPEGYSNRTITYPITYITKAMFEDVIGEKYDIQFKIEEDAGGFCLKGEAIIMDSYFCILKNN